MSEKIRSLAQSHVTEGVNMYQKLKVEYKLPSSGEPTLWKFSVKRLFHIFPPNLSLRFLAIGMLFQSGWSINFAKNAVVTAPALYTNFYVPGNEWFAIGYAGLVLAWLIGVYINKAALWFLPIIISIPVNFFDAQSLSQYGIVWNDLYCSLAIPLSIMLAAVGRTSASQRNGMDPTAKL